MKRPCFSVDPLSLGSEESQTAAAEAFAEVMNRALPREGVRGSKSSVSRKLRSSYVTSFHQS
eukprot:11410806-Karenia_brevis.AAC.1